MITTDAIEDFRACAMADALMAIWKLRRVADEEATIEWLEHDSDEQEKDCQP